MPKPQVMRTRFGRRYSTAWVTVELPAAWPNGDPRRDRRLARRKAARRRQYQQRVHDLQADQYAWLAPYLDQVAAMGKAAGLVLAEWQKVLAAMTLASRAAARARTTQTITFRQQPSSWPDRFQGFSVGGLAMREEKG